MGISFGSIISMASQIALAAATGGTSLAMQAAMKAVATAIVQQVIQMEGDK